MLPPPVRILFGNESRVLIGYRPGQVHRHQYLCLQPDAQDQVFMNGISLLETVLLLPTSSVLLVPRAIQGHAMDLIKPLRTGDQLGRFLLALVLNSCLSLLPNPHLPGKQTCLHPLS